MFFCGDDFEEPPIPARARLASCRQCGPSSPRPNIQTRQDFAQKGGCNPRSIVYYHVL